MPRSFAPALLAVLLLGAGLARADDRAVDYGEDRLLSWYDDDGSFLWLGAWIVTDFHAFPRTETAYGASWDANIRLRSAHATARFRWGPWLCGRLDGEYSDSLPDLQEAWFEHCGLAPHLQVRAGRLRVPFGLVQQLQVPELSLIDAPMIAGNPKDFRDLGLELHGTVWHDRIRWAVAVVTGSRDIAIDVNEKPDVAGRLTVHPLMGLGPWFERLHVGGSASWGEGPTRHGFRGETMTDYTFVSPPTIRGVRWRAAAELEWTTPAFRIAAEYQYLRHDRDGITDNQRIGGVMVPVGDLDPYEVWGWYVEASGHVFGEDDERGDPLTGLELAARFEHLEFGDGDRTVATTTDPENHGPLTDSRVQAITGGVRYLFGYGLCLGAAYQALRYADAALASDHEDGDPDDGEAWVHSVFLRGQIVY